MTPVLVVMRNLTQPVVHAVIQIPESVLREDRTDWYEKQVLEDEKRRFCDQFVEFKRADWTISRHGMTEGFKP